MAESFTTCRETNTLEDSLKQFDMKCLIEELDISLELVRRMKATEKEHLDVLKSVDRNLLKLSRIHHPDKAINEKKTEQEVEYSQNRQVALNATRTVLQALTKAFLSDIDIHYRYEFFAKMNISSLINEKEMDRQMKNVLSKIGFLSEVKRVNIVGEIRKFLQESQKSLEIFQEDDRDEFERRRDYALRHLHKCIEGYEVLATECELVMKECRGEQDGSTMQKIYDQSRRELKILQDLERVAEKSLHGKFQVFSILEPANSYDRYLISPFVLYINVMLMCTTVINGKLNWFMRKKNFVNHNTHASLHFDTIPDLFFNAYNFASYFNNESKYEWAVVNILRKKGLDTTDDNIIKVFKDYVKEIADFLAKEFVIDTYKKGKSNREHFAEKLSRLNESRSGYEEVEKLLEQCKKGSDEIRKEYSKYSEKIQETEEQCRKNILKCKNTSEKISKLMSGCYHKEGTRSRNYGSELNGTVSRNEIKEFAETILSEKLEEFEKIAEDLLEFLKDCTENVSEHTGSRSSFDSKNEYTVVITEEVEKKIKGSYELNKKIAEQLCCLMKKKHPKFEEQISVNDEDRLGDIPLHESSDTIAGDEIGKSSNISDVQSLQTSSVQNLTQNHSAIIIGVSTSYVPNYEPVSLLENHFGEQDAKN